MEVLIERELTPYEVERGKPIPDFIHALIQVNLIFELRVRYGKELRLLSELSLATEPVGTTPDLAIYPFLPRTTTTGRLAKASRRCAASKFSRSPKAWKRWWRR